MSYDIDLICAHCEQRFCDGLNPTYNLTPIFDLALTNESMPNLDIPESAVVLFGYKTDRPRGLRIFNGVKAEDSLKQLKQAALDLRNPDKEASFRALEPENKWGDLEVAIWVIVEMIERAERYPKATWRIQ